VSIDSMSRLRAYSSRAGKGASMRSVCVVSGCVSTTEDQHTFLGADSPQCSRTWICRRPVRPDVRIDINGMSGFSGVDDAGVSTARDKTHSAKAVRQCAPRGLEGRWR
jgi:hypothetical protein